MNTNDFELLFKITALKITKSDSHFKKSIHDNEKLLVTFRYLTTGDSFHSHAVA